MRAASDAARASRHPGLPPVAADLKAVLLSMAGLLAEDSGPMVLTGYYFQLPVLDMKVLPEQVVRWEANRMILDVVACGGQPVQPDVDHALFSDPCLVEMPNDTVTRSVSAGLRGDTLRRRK